MPTHNKTNRWQSLHYTITLTEYAFLNIETNAKRTTRRHPVINLSIKLPKDSYKYPIRLYYDHLAPLCKALKSPEFSALCGRLYDEASNIYWNTDEAEKLARYQKQYNELMCIDSTTVTPLTLSTIPKDETRLT